MKIQIPNFKEMNKADVKKYLYYGACGLILLVFIIFASVSGGDETKEKKSDDFTNPEAEAENYKSKLEAQNAVAKDKRMGELENVQNERVEREAQERKDREKEDFLDNIDKQLANIGKETPPPVTEPTEVETPADPITTQHSQGGRQSRPSNTAPRTSTKSSGSNSHSVYGDASMWSTEPKKSKAQERREKMKEKYPEYYADSKANDEIDREVSSYYQETGQRPAHSYSGDNSKKSKFDRLSEQEQTRILRELQMPYYEETPQIEAKIISSGEVFQGSVIKIQTAQEAILDFKRIPAGTVLSGEVEFQNNRMVVKLSTFIVKGKIVNANLDVYSMDGLLGFPISGRNVNREVANENKNDIVEAAVGTVGGSIGRSLSRTVRKYERGSEANQSVNLGTQKRCLLRNRDI